MLISLHATEAGDADERGGQYFENYVMVELLKNYANSKMKANLTYYRNSSTKEVDVSVEENSRIHPLEIKKTANPDRREVQKFSIIEKTALERAVSGIVCMCEDVIQIDREDSFIPRNLI